MGDRGKMPRLQPPTRESLSLEGQAAWDEIVGSRGRVVGPFFALLKAPAVAQRVAALGEQLRFHSSFSAADRELAILTAGREVEARFEWAAHEPLARREGTRPEAIEAVQSRGPLDSLTPRERLTIGLVRALYRHHAVPDALFQEAIEQFGEQGLVELITLAGYYGMIGFVLNSFEVPLPEGAQSPF
jgi:4-carboxymuconolactone decarboxylase